MYRQTLAQIQDTFQELLVKLNRGKMHLQTENVYRRTTYGEVKVTKCLIKIKNR